MVTDIPQGVLDYAATLRNDGPVNAIDPDFEVPSQYRWNLGFTHALPWDVEMTADLIYSRVNDEVLWRDIRLQQVGTAPDGRRSNALLTRRARQQPGPLPLTNTDEGKSTVWTVDFSKTWRTASGRFDAYFGYGHQDVEDVNPGTSSTASSNWDNVAVSDPNDPGLATNRAPPLHDRARLAQGLLRRLRDERRALRRATLRPPVQPDVRQRFACLGRPAPVRAPAPALLRAGRRRAIRSAMHGCRRVRRDRGLREHAELHVGDAGRRALRRGHGRIHRGAGTREVPRQDRAAQCAAQPLGHGARPSHRAGTADLPEVASESSLSTSRTSRIS